MLPNISLVLPSLLLPFKVFLLVLVSFFAMVFVLRRKFDFVRTLRCGLVQMERQTRIF
jgi:hypothetical protein